MRFPAAILVAACTLAAGCTALSGRNRDRDRDRDPAPTGRPDREWWEDGTPAGRGKHRTDPDGLGRGNRETIVAGVLLDGRDGRPLKGVTYIRVRPAEE